MARPTRPQASSPSSSVIGGLTVAALVGLGFAGASTWVHYRLLYDPFYSSSICDLNALFSCTEAYTSRFGSLAGVPIALLGVLFFALILVLIALCTRSASARQNLAGYVFVLSTLGLAGVLYLAYASFFVLQTVCLLCVGTYAAVIALFVLSGSAEKSSMSSLAGRASRDLRTLGRTPAALGVVIAFLAAAVWAVTMFPSGSPVAAAAASAAPGDGPAQASTQAPAPLQPLSPELQRELGAFLAKQPRVQVPGGGSGAAVVIVKFNDYQCPPCGATFREYGPVIAQLQKEHPGRIAYITRDFPLDPECNTLAGPQSTHTSACEAAVAVRLAREKGRADAMEQWLFANQSSLTPDGVKRAAASVGGATDFDARFPQLLELVRADIAQGLQLGVNGTPTFFMNGLRLPIWPGNVFKAAVEWELQQAR